jgi:hypothetical protein
MAIPFLSYDPNQEVYQIWIHMGSANKVKGRETIDEFKVIIDHKYPQKVRREIQALRQEINRMTDNSCIKYYSAKFTNGLGLNQLRDACQRIDREMKQIDPTLYCEIKAKKEVFGVKQNMTFYDELTSGLRDQIINTMLKRVETIIERSPEGSLKPKTRDSLIKMFEQMKGLNIVQSPEVNQEIDQMKQKILSSTIKEIRDDLLEILETNKDRSTALEILDPVKIPSEPQKPKSEIDHNKVILDIL